MKVWRIVYYKSSPDGINIALVVYQQRYKSVYTDVYTRQIRAAILASSREMDFLCIGIGNISGLNRLVPGSTCVEYSEKKDRIFAFIRT